MAYHLFKRLFSTINEIILDDDNDACNLQTFLAANDGLGFKMIKIISDLNMSVRIFVITRFLFMSH
jgi:hypothetical protein